MKMKNKKLQHFSVAIGFSLMALTASSGWALSPTNEPGQIERRFEKQVEPRRAEPAVETPNIAPGKTIHKNAKPFLLKGVNFAGVSVYDQKALNELSDPYVGKKITLSEVDSIAEALNAKYRADGYLLSFATVPDQNPKNGTARIEVVEGYVGNVVIEGDHVESGSRNLVQSYGEKIKADRPLKAATLERYLLLVDDLPGVTARGVMRRGAATGAAELVIQMQHKKYEASAEFNNRGTKFIGREQYQLTGAANSALGLYDRTLVRGIHAGPWNDDELNFFDIQHEEQIGSEGTKIKGTLGYTHTNPGDTLKPLDIEGRATSFQLEVNTPLIRSREQNFTPRAVFSYRNTDTDISGTDFNNDRIRVLRVGGAYDISDAWGGVNLFDGEVSQGLDIFGATDKGAGRSRIDGENDFTKINLDITRLQALPGSFSLLLAAAGQYSFDPLLAPEEFALGGLGFGQAYDPSEITGDHGAAGKVELRWGNTVGYEYFNNYQLYGYYDLGAVWQRQPLSGVDHRQSLSDAGVGIRANFTEWLSATGELAFPLTRDVAAEGDDDPRLFFSVIGRF